MNAGDDEDPMRIVVMGVAGCGKSTVARDLAGRLDARFLEADEFHLPASIEKMSNDMPLDDDDRRPWLHALRRSLGAERRVVLACSALKRPYRDILRGAGDVRFVFLDVDRPEIERRVAGRQGHFMGAAMIDSQFAALQRPGTDETDIATVRPQPGDDVTASVVTALGSLLR